MKETRKHFEKISNDLDTALVKNSQASRNKPHECEEVNNIVLATRSGFLHTALDYVFQVCSTPGLDFSLYGLRLLEFSFNVIIASAIIILVSIIVGVFVIIIKVFITKDKNNDQ